MLHKCAREIFLKKENTRPIHSYPVLWAFFVQDDDINRNAFLWLMKSEIKKDQERFDANNGDTKLNKITVLTPLIRYLVHYSGAING